MKYGKKSGNKCGKKSGQQVIMDNNKEKEKLNKALNFWQDVLKMIWLLALYSCIYYAFPVVSAFFGLHGNIVNYLGIASYLVSGGVVFFLLPKEHRNMRPRIKAGEKATFAESFLLSLAVIMISLGTAYFLNRGFGIIPWDKILPADAVYSSDYAFQIPLRVSLPAYGIVAPFAEEVAFRGILFKYLSKWMNIIPAILISAVIFGLYHGNVMQGIYAFLMGVLLALMMHLTDSLAGSAICHMSANILVTLYANIPEFYAVLMSVPGMLVMGVITAAGIVLFTVMKKRGKNQ